jgi:hypothetical protein
MWFRLLFIFSGLAIGITLIARWWFGLRVLRSEGQRPCKCDLARWMPSPGDSAVIHRAEETAGEFGRQLRLKAMEEWRSRDPKASRARESSRRFGMAVPPLSGVVAVFAVLVAKIPIFGAIAVCLAATALATILGMLSLAPELQAIAAAARKLRAERCFPRRDDEDAVIQSAIAHAWKENLPPVLQILQK